jgi:hypothetical protein
VPAFHINNYFSGTFFAEEFLQEGRSSIKGIFFAAK